MLQDRPTLRAESIVLRTRLSPTVEVAIEDEDPASAGPPVPRAKAGEPHDDGATTSFATLTGLGVSRCSVPFSTFTKYRYEFDTWL